MISGRRSALLVARREIGVRARDRSVLVSTGLTLVIVAAIILLPSLFGGTSTATVAVARADAGGVRAAQAATRVDQAFDVVVEVRRVRDDAAVRRLVAGGDADAGLLAGGRRILAAGGAPD
ncbi:MAG: hypothetical protein ACR2LH_08090, partial [Thermoleophilaceae bacterium]